MLQEIERELQLHETALHEESEETVEVSPDELKYQFGTSTNTEIHKHRRPS